MTSSRCESSPLKERPSLMTYRTYVASLCSRNPSLLNLHHFLVKSADYGLRCRLYALDFREGFRNPISRSIADTVYLHSEFTRKSSEAGYEHSSELDVHHPLQGRVIVIEDLTPSVVELLGSELDVDPLFFALHLHTAQRAGMRRQNPAEATLPTRLNSQNYINTAYHLSLLHDVETPAGGRLMRNTVIDRKLVFLPHTKIGLAQQCASVLKVKRSDDFWLAIVLVDPPISDTYWVDGQKGKEGSEVHLPTQPYLGDYEDFLVPPAFSRASNTELDPVREGMFKDLQHYWTHSSPPGFHSKDPSLASLAYFPLKIVAAEWTKYITVMHNCIKQYEYKSDKLPDLAQFDTNLYELQSWRRRSLYSQQKIKAVLSLLKSHSVSSANADDYCSSSLLEDYEYLLQGIQEAGQRLENMLPVVTSLVQIADARHSFAETANISRLTILAMVFVPLNFVSSLFSMNADNAPGSKHFWVYFVVAFPVTIIVFLVARPPQKDITRFWRWLREKKERTRRSSRQSSLKRAMTDFSSIVEKDV